MYNLILLLYTSLRMRQFCFIEGFVVVYERLKKIIICIFCCYLKGDKDMKL